MADKSFEETLDRAVSSLADKGVSLKEEQQISIKLLVQEGHLLAVLPNGCSKSLIFQMLALRKNKSCLSVIRPLRSIVHDQIREASSTGLSAAQLSECSINEIQTDTVQLLFVSTENSLEKEFFALMKNESCAFHQNLAAIVVDESHTIDVKTDLWTCEPEISCVIMLTNKKRRKWVLNMKFWLSEWFFSYIKAIYYWKIYGYLSLCYKWVM